MAARLVGIHHVGLRVFDPDEAAERWSRQFGLSIAERYEDRVLLRCSFEDYSLELIRSAASATVADADVVTTGLLIRSPTVRARGPPPSAIL